MSREFFDEIEAALPELHAVDRSHLRDALQEWYESQPSDVPLPPVKLAAHELRLRLGLPVPEKPPVDVPADDEPPVEEPPLERPAVEDPGSTPSPAISPRGLGKANPKTVLFSGLALVVLGTLFNWWNATPGFTLDVVSVDSPSIEVIWVDADQPSRVVRCSQGELEFAARVTVDRGATIRSVTMPLLDDEWAANGSVERVVAEASPVGSDQSYPLEGYVVGTQGNTDHDIRLVYRIADCDQIEQMPSTSELDIAYSFHGRDRQVGLVLPERLAFIDEDCLAEAIAAGECPA